MPQQTADIFIFPGPQEKPKTKRETEILLLSVDIMPEENIEILWADYLIVAVCPSLFSAPLSLTVQGVEGVEYLAKLLRKEARAKGYRFLVQNRTSIESMVLKDIL